MLLRFKIQYPMKNRGKDAKAFMYLQAGKYAFLPFKVRLPSPPVQEVYFSFCINAEEGTVVYKESFAFATGMMSIGIKNFTTEMHADRVGYAGVAGDNVKNVELLQGAIDGSFGNWRMVSACIRSVITTEPKR